MRGDKGEKLRAGGVGGCLAVVDSLDPGLRERWREDAVAIVADGGAETKAALDAVGGRAVLLRPDKYLLGTADSAAELERLVGLVPWRRAPAPSA